jgi:protein-disulfide isomerase
MTTSDLQTPVSDIDHSLGISTAPITLLEYGDYECPYCGKAYSQVKAIEKHFGKSLRFIFRNFPLINYHPHALLAAAAAEAAAQQGKFWEMHSILFTNQTHLTAADLLKYAERLQLDTEIFSQAIRDKELIDRVRADYVSGELSGVEGTPTFFVNEIKVEGPATFENLKEEILRISGASPAADLDVF